MYILDLHTSLRRKKFKMNDSSMELFQSQKKFFFLSSNTAKQPILIIFPVLSVCLYGHMKIKWPNMLGSFSKIFHNKYFSKE